MRNHLINILRLIRSENVGPITFIKLVEQYGSVEKALEILPILTKKNNKNFKIYPKDKAIKEIEQAEALGVTLIPYTSDLYPPLLLKTEDFPPVLFVKGHTFLLKKSAIGIVGSRNASLLGKQNAFNLAQKLGENGFLVISGMAKGIDAAAHEGSLTKGTLAFLGGGVDQIYPKENAQLYEKIAHQGALVSEFPLGSACVASNFPRRNRLIAGTSKGILVVEASLNSGSLITAQIALDQSREVFAIPGNPGDARSKGTNFLIKQGAILTESVQDIINNIKKSQSLMENIPPFQHAGKGALENEKCLNDTESLQKSRLYLKEMLSASAISIDLLIRHSDLEAKYIFTVILELELNGHLERLPGNKVSLINPLP
ncbi:DNA-protecting protein DprA [Candidatus Hepatincolaceae symbiont of Richtersius coronifer]